jgi:hypothetical protein
VVLRQAQTTRRQRPGAHRPTGWPVWVPDVEPGSVHDISAARVHALPALYPAAAAGLPTLTDKGYAGAGIGIAVPFKGNRLSPDNQAHNKLINALRAPAERANALLKEHLASAAPDHPRPPENRRHHSRRTRTTQPSETSPVRRPHYFTAVWKLDHAEVLTSFL